jgi:hypothetical protein
MTRRSRQLNTLALVLVAFAAVVYGTHFVVSKAVETGWLRWVWVGLLAAALAAEVASRLVAHRSH